MYNIYVKLTIDKTTTAGINYKELYDSKWDPMTFMNNTLYIKSSGATALTGLWPTERS